VWRVAAASVRGVAHERTGAPCQDACRFVETRGVLVAAVADGAGSAALAEVGAQLVVEAAISAIAQRDELSDSFTDEELAAQLLRAAFRDAVGALGREASALGRAPSELASTLIVAVVAPQLVVAAQVGDGACVVQGPNGLRCLTVPQGGEYANETTFLTSAGMEAALQVSVSPGRCDRLALFSDGLQRLALNMADAAPHGPFFSPLFRFLEAVPDPADATQRVRSFLTSPRLAERTDDDLTLLLATRVE
jgi:hypothetical protein